MRPVRNVFQKLSRTEQRREGVVAYLWCRESMRAKVKCSMCLAGWWKGWLTPNDKPEMVFIVYHFSEMHSPPLLF
jgi:hypothetical protein